VSDDSEIKHELADTRKKILRVMDAANHKQDQERSPRTWRSIRDGGLGFLISICVFAATASIVSALLKSPFFAEFFDRDDYRRADGFAGLIGALAWLCTIFFLARSNEQSRRQ
jgi:hypothetical protein